MRDKECVSFKTAEILNKTGFNESTPMCFRDDGMLAYPTFNDTKRKYIAAPTITQAMDWLREEKGVHVAIIQMFDCGGVPDRYAIWLQGNAVGGKVEIFNREDHYKTVNRGIYEACKRLLKQEKKE